MNYKRIFFIQRKKSISTYHCHGNDKWIWIFTSFFAVIVIIAPFFVFALQEIQKSITDDMSGRYIESNTGFYEPLMKSIISKRRINEQALWQAPSPIRLLNPDARVAITRDNRFLSIFDGFIGYEDISGNITLPRDRILFVERLQNEWLVSDGNKIEILKGEDRVMRTDRFLNIGTVGLRRVSSIACSNNNDACLILSTSDKKLVSYSSGNLVSIDLSGEIDLGTAALVKSGPRLYIGGTQAVGKTVIFKLFYYDISPRKITIDGSLFTFNRIERWVFGDMINRGLLYIRADNKAQYLEYDGAGGWNIINDPFLQSIVVENPIVSFGGKWLLRQRDALYLYDSFGFAYDIFPQLNKKTSGIVWISEHNDAPLVITQKEVIAIKDNGFEENATIESRQINERDSIISAVMTWDDDNGFDDITYQISNDNGETWHTISEKGARVSFLNEGYVLRYRAVMRGTSYTTPRLKKIAVTYSTKDISTRGKQARDRRRTDDLSTTARLLEVYFKDFGRFPRVDNIKPDEGWKELQLILQSAGKTNRKNYAGGFPFPQDSDYPYYYRSSFNDYALASELEEGGSAYLAKDADGTTLDFNCNDPLYCLTRDLHRGPQKTSAPPPQTVSPQASISLKDFNVAGLIQIKGDTKVYRDIGKGQIIWIQSKEIFEKLRYVWSAIKFITRTEFQNYRLARIVKEKNQSAIYLVNENGYKRRIANPVIFGSYGRSLKDIPEIERELLDFLPSSDIIRLKGDKKIFVIIDNEKHWITTPDAFRALGLKWEQVIEVTKKDFDSYPTRESIGD